MQTSILSVLLAFGLPGANSCSAQQQGLPRVGQTPPAATQGEEPKPAVADKEEADEEEVDEPMEMNADEAEDVDEPLAEIAEIKAEKDAGQSHCQGSGSCEAQSGPQLGRVSQPTEPSRARAGSLALGGGMVNVEGEMVYVDGDDSDGNVQRVTIAPGSTVIVKCKNGEQVVLRAHGADALQNTSSSEHLPLMALPGFAYTTQSEPQKNDDRVRELEQRVRELEAQLRERDGQAAARSPLASKQRSDQAHAEAREQAAQQRAQMRELQQRMSAQAREQAAQARKQADDIRRQVEMYQEQALEQQKLWRADSQDGQPKEFSGWKTQKAPKPPKAPRLVTPAPAPAPDVAVEAAPEPPATPGMPAPEGANVYGVAPGQAAPRAHAPRTPTPPRANTGPGGEHVQELQQMLNEMRRQMDEMREQMQSLRQELERAPQREMR
jgi:hypothetical protein